MTILFENVNYLSGALNATVKRTPAARAGDIFNIYDFGGANPPDPTGVLDSSIAVQAAVFAAGATGTYPNVGGRIYVPKGVYKISQPIDLSSTAGPIYIGGDGRASVLQATCLGFVLCWAGQVGGGGGAVQLTAAAASPNTPLIRFTITGTGQSPGFAPKPTKLIAQNMPYTMTVSGTGTVGALNGTVQRFIIVDDTHIDVIGSTWGGGGTLSSGSLAGGSNANTALTIADLTINNGQFDVNSGAVYIGYSANQSNIRNCALQGYIGADVASNIWIGGSFGVSVSDCIITCVGTFGMADRSNTGGVYAGGPPGSVGLFLGEGIAADCRAQLFETGFTMGGSNANIVGCSVERCNLGVQIGRRDDNPSDTAQGGTLLGTQFERCNTSVQVSNFSNGMVSGCTYLLSTGTPDFANFTGGVWSSGTVTLTTQNNHNLGANGNVVPININTIGTQQANLATWIPPGLRQNRVLCTIASANTLTYALASPPTGGNSFTGGNWTIGPTAAVQVFSAATCSFIANDTGSFPAPAYDLSASFGIQANCVIQSDQVAAGIVDPFTTNKAAWKFVNCGKIEGTYPLKFGELPGQAPAGNVNQPGPIENQEYTIIDGQTANCVDGTCTTFGTVVNGGSGAGSGGLHLKIRWNGAAWTLCGR